MQSSQQLSHSSTPNHIEFLCDIVACPKTKRGDFSTLDVNNGHLLYFNGPLLVVKELSSSILKIFCHLSDVSAAKFSSDGRFVASVDEKGTLYIHEITDKQLIVSKKYDNFYAGARAIEWTSDRKRLCVVGSAKNCFGRVVSIETANDVGQISGVSANLTCCAFAPTAPFSLVTGGDQFVTKFFQGPPYKFLKSSRNHTTYMNAIKFDPSNTYIASTGSDKKIVIYDRQKLQLLRQKANCHTGSIYGLDWIDSSRIVTVSADKSIKIWNVELEQLAQIMTCDSQQMKSFKQIDNFQVAVKHYEGRIYTISLNGQVRSFDVPQEKGKQISLKDLNVKTVCSGWLGKPKKVIQLDSHQNDYDEFIVLDSNGKILQCTLIKGQSDNSMYNINMRVVNRNQARSITDGFSLGKTIYVLWSDGNISSFDIERDPTSQISLKQSFIIENINAKFIEKSFSKQNDLIALSNNALFGFQKQQQNIKVPISDDPTALRVALHCVCVGTVKGKLFIFDPKTLEQISKVDVSATKLSYIYGIQNNQCHSKTTLIIGDALGKLRLISYDSEAKSHKQLPDCMGNHQSLITSILSIPGTNSVITTGMEGKINIWESSKQSCEDFKRTKDLKNIHQLGIISAQLINSTTLVTLGGDYLAKTWKVSKL